MRQEVRNKVSVEIQKVPGGLLIDGIRLMNGKCGCTSVLKCCYSWSKVKRKGADVEFEAKATGPDTKDIFNWGYKVRKDGSTVTVKVEDARDKEIYSGFIPPPASEWDAKEWEVVEKEGEREDGTVWRCAMCKWLYKDSVEDPPFEKLPDDWECPTCGAIKNYFEKIG